MAVLLSLKEAVAEFVCDRDAVAREGFTHLIPFAASHEVIRAGRRELTLVRMTPDLIYDQLVGMGCARMAVLSSGGNPGVGSLHRLRDAVDQGCLARTLRPGKRLGEEIERLQAGRALVVSTPTRRYQAEEIAAVGRRLWESFRYIAKVTRPLQGSEAH